MKMTRPKNAYMRFAQDERPSIAKEHPGLGIVGIAKELGVRYAKLTDEEKERYTELAKKEFEQKTKTVV